MPRTDKSVRQWKAKLKNILFYLMAAIAALVEQGTSIRMKKKIINSSLYVEHSFMARGL